jgi:hypothetical protein
MAGDGPGVRHELTLAGTGRPPDKNSKGMHSRGTHKRKRRKDNVTSTPSRAGTKAEAADKPLVRGSPSHSTKLSQSQLEPNKAAALQPPMRHPRTH